MDNPFSPLDRRQFLTGAAACAFLAASPMMAAEPGVPRLRRLRLLTATPLAEMRRFYHDLLGQQVLAETPGELTIGVGATAITFVAAPPEAGKPFYHVAFNIPENKLLAARTWQLERTTLLPPMNASLVDPRFPSNVTHFASWNAHSVFFWDPGGNLLEYIARHDLDNAAPGGFTSDDLLYASEIAFITDAVPSVARGVREAFGLPQYRPPSDIFEAIGDEHGLLLVIEEGRNWWGKPSAIYPTVAEIAGHKPSRYDIPGLPYAISVG